MILRIWYETLDVLHVRARTIRGLGDTDEGVWAEIARAWHCEGTVSILEVRARSNPPVSGAMTHDQGT